MRCAHVHRIQGFPELGKTVLYDEAETIDPDTVALNGGFLVKMLYLSADPYLRGQMRPAHIKSYAVRPSCCLDSAGEWS